MGFKNTEEPNLKYIKELAEGDKEFEETILSVLKKELPLEHALFKKDFEDKNYVKAADKVHKLKHKISILGLKKGSELASKFEKDLKSNEITLYKDFLDILDKIHVYLEVNNF